MWSRLTRRRCKLDKLLVQLAAEYWERDRRASRRRLSIQGQDGRRETGKLVRAQFKGAMALTSEVVSGQWSVVITGQLVSALGIGNWGKNALFPPTARHQHTGMPHSRTRTTAGFLLQHANLGARCTELPRDALGGGTSWQCNSPDWLQVSRHVLPIRSS